MDSERIKCPVDGGKCGYVRCIALGHCWARPPKHEGTAVLSSPDPTTAGSETPAGPSRRRSLPALAELQREVSYLRDKARREAREAITKGNQIEMAANVGADAALSEVLMRIEWVSHEEPEGNNQALPEGGAQPH